MKKTQRASSGKRSDKAKAGGRGARPTGGYKSVKGSKSAEGHKAAGGHKASAPHKATGGHKASAPHKATGGHKASAPRKAAGGHGATGGPKAPGGHQATVGRRGRPEGRIPVRGARKSKVQTRPAVEVTTRSLLSEDQLSETRGLAVMAMEAALDKQALAPILIDVSAMGSYTDFIGIVSGRSDRQVDAIAENVAHELKGRGLYLLGQEGTGSGRWTLLDFGAFVIHVFYHPVREFYDLESLWIEAPRVKLEIPPDAHLPQPDALYGAL